MLGNTPTTLSSYLADAYSLTRELRGNTLHQYQVAVTLFERWHGSPIALADLSEQLLSRWLVAYSANHSSATVRAKRVAILAIWRAAADDGLASDPVARRIRRVTLPARPVEAWSLEEVEQLLLATRRLKRRHRCGLTRAQWFDLAVRVAWDSGLRLGDQLSLTVAAIRPDGSASVTQSKTQKVVTFRLSATTMAALARSLQACPRRLVLPWEGSHETFCAQVRALVRLAGIRPGTWKWLRRASGTDVERQQEGAGHLHLGNTRQVFLSHYADASQLPTSRPSPRELAG